ncbi:MAG: 2-dehydropantoate 2-reductase [Myxococcota bacterium]
MTSGHSQVLHCYTPPMQSTPPRILIVGVGSLGGTIAGSLLAFSAELVTEVIALTSNQAVIEATQQHGFRLQGIGEPLTAEGAATDVVPDGTGPFDWIILATQPPQVEDAARSSLPHLAHDGAMICLQNGLCEERVAEIVGRDRVIGAVVGWGASSPEPGVFERTSTGGFTIGRLDGTDDPRLIQLASLLEVVGPVTITDNLAGARWSKLAINCAISTLGTIGGDRLGVLMRYRFVRRLVLEIMTETVRVAQTEGVKLEKISGTLDLEWLALTTEEQATWGSTSLVTKHAMLLAVGTRYRRLRSSMLAAIERGRPPAVDFLNGEVVRHGARHSIPTPVNAAAAAMVHAIATGELKSSHELCRTLAEHVGVWPPLLRKGATRREVPGSPAQED